MTLSRQVIQPQNAALDQSRKFGLPMSAAIRGGDFVFVSGMTAIDPVTGERAHGTVAAETRQILTNMGELLGAAGSSLAKGQCADLFDARVRKHELGLSRVLPDRSARPDGMRGQLIGGHKVEIECVALASPAGPEPMTDRLPRSVIEPANPKLNVSRSANLPHSPGIRVGDDIFLSGMGPVDPVTGGRNLGPIAEQIRQTLLNMAHMLETAGSGLDRIVRMTVVLADSADYDEMNRVWRESSRWTRRCGPPAPCSSATATASRLSASLSPGKARPRALRPRRSDQGRSGSGDMDLKLAGKVVLITGSSRGIGLATAKAFAAEGGRIMLSARSSEQLRDAEEALSATGAVVAVHAADVGDPAGAAALIDATIAVYGGIDVLVNNVGGGGGGARIADSSDDDWRGALERNLVQTVRMMRLALQHMKGRPGATVINIASISGWTPQLAMSGQYGAAKAALIFEAERWALEFVPYGIRVNTVSPGSILVEGNGWDRYRLANPDYFEDYVRHGFPMGRLGAAAEVADVIVFAASPRAHWINGRNIPVDGLEQPHAPLDRRPY